jgi:hypothetical protein
MASCCSYAGAGKCAAVLVPVFSEEELSGKGVVCSMFGL